MKNLTSSNYKKDQFYPAVARAMSEILAAGAVVAPVEVLLRMGRITKQQCEDWRFGRIPYLERVSSGNLAKLSRILRILDLHARAIGLTPSQTVYHKWGRGGKKILLRFSKSGDPHLEAAYSRHYVAKARLASEASRRKSQAPTDAGTGGQVTKPVPSQAGSIVSPRPSDGRGAGGEGGSNNIAVDHPVAFKRVTPGAEGEGGSNDIAGRRVPSSQTLFPSDGRGEPSSADEIPF